MRGRAREREREKDGGGREEGREDGWGGEGGWEGGSEKEVGREQRKKGKMAFSSSVSGVKIYMHISLCIVYADTHAARTSVLCMRP